MLNSDGVTLTGDDVVCSYAEPAPVWRFMPAPYRVLSVEHVHLPPGDPVTLRFRTDPGLALTGVQVNDIEVAPLVVDCVVVFGEDGAYIAASSVTYAHSGAVAVAAVARPVHAMIVGLTGAMADIDPDLKAILAGASGPRPDGSGESGSSERTDADQGRDQPGTDPFDALVGGVLAAGAAAIAAATPKVCEAVAAVAAELFGELFGEAPKAGPAPSDQAAKSGPGPKSPSLALAADALVAAVFKEMRRR